jgi:hypothetical protein
LFISPYFTNLACCTYILSYPTPCTCTYSFISLIPPVLYTPSHLRSPHLHIFLPLFSTLCIYTIPPSILLSFHFFLSPHSLTQFFSFQFFHLISYPTLSYTNTPLTHSLTLYKSLTLAFIYSTYTFALHHLFPIHSLRLHTYTLASLLPISHSACTYLLPPPLSLCISSFHTLTLPFTFRLTPSHTHTPLYHTLPLFLSHYHVLTLSCTYTHSFEFKFEIWVGT